MFEGVPCFSFINNAPEDDADADENKLDGIPSKATTVEEYRSLRNRACRRIIPVHPALLKNPPGTRCDGDTLAEMPDQTPWEDTARQDLA